MSITVANFIIQYLRTNIPDATEFTDAVLGYWIDAALRDISRSFPRKTYAQWDCTTGLKFYAFSDSTTIAKDTNIIRILTCSYPYVSTADYGDWLDRKSHLDPDFDGGNYYDPDLDFGILYVGPAVVTTKDLYADCHIYWAVATATIVNPQEHYELIRLFCIWQSYLHRLSDLATSPVANFDLIASLTLEAKRSELAYHAAYTLLDQAKATSGQASGWTMDKWDERAR